MCPYGEAAGDGEVVGLGLAVGLAVGLTVGPAVGLGVTDPLGLGLGGGGGCFHSAKGRSTVASWKSLGIKATDTLPGKGWGGSTSA